MNDRWWKKHLSFMNELATTLFLSRIIINSHQATHILAPIDIPLFSSSRKRKKKKAKESIHSIYLMIGMGGGIQTYLVRRKGVLVCDERIGRVKDHYGTDWQAAVINFFFFFLV